MPGSTLGLCGVPFFWQKFKTPILLQIPLEKCAINELQGKKKNVEQVQLSTGYR